MNETDILIPNDLDLIDQPKSAEIIPELLLCHALVETAKIHVPACIALADGKSHLGRNGRRLSPTNLKLLSVERQLLDRGVRVESSSGRAIQKGQKHARFFGEDADRFERPKVHEVEQLVDRRGCGEVADINCPPCGISRCGERGGQCCWGVSRLGGWDVEVERRHPLLAEVLHRILEISANMKADG